MAMERAHHANGRGFPRPGPAPARPGKLLLSRGSDNMRWSWRVGSKPGKLVRIRPITNSAAFAVGLATLPLSTPKAQSYPPPSYPVVRPFHGLGVLRGGCHTRL